MDKDIHKAVNALRTALQPGHSGSVMVVLDGIGALSVQDGVVSTGPCQADCTLTASTQTFRALLLGTLSPERAYLTGALRIDGSFAAAMTFGRHLT